MDRYQYQYISDNYPEEIQFSKDHIKIFTLDIECSAENSFSRCTKSNRRNTLYCRINLTNRL